MFMKINSVSASSHIDGMTIENVHIKSTTRPKMFNIMQMPHSIHAHTRTITHAIDTMDVVTVCN